MTPSDRSKIGEAWLVLAQIYGKEITHPALKMMIDAISDLPFETTLRIMSDWPKTSKLQRHPFPAEIREKVNPTISADAEATAVAGRIFQAISKFGWPNSKEAQLFIGELGWSAVKRMGGWTRVCEMVGVDYDKAAFLAHVKSIAKSEAEYSAAGRHDEAPALPEPSVSAKVFSLPSLKSIE